jgi:hypothetical protein
MKMKVTSVLPIGKARYQIAVMWIPHIIRRLLGKGITCEEYYGSGLTWEDSKKKLVIDAELAMLLRAYVTMWDAL